MIFAVHKRTKEHRVQSDGDFFSPDWRPAQADPDGWIKHDGGECPLPDGQEVEIVVNEGKVKRKVVADSDVMGWRAVEHYRPILNSKEEEMSKEWDGEGLPPVGCEVEALADDEWVRAEWFKKHNGEHAVFFIRSRALGWAKDIRPIRSEEDRAVEEMAKAGECSYADETATYMVASGIYRAIRDGLIPGVRVEGK